MSQTRLLALGIVVGLVALIGVAIGSGGISFTSSAGATTAVRTPAPTAVAAAPAPTSGASVPTAIAAAPAAVATPNAEQINEAIARQQQDESEMCQCRQ